MFDSVKVKDFLRSALCEFQINAGTDQKTHIEQWQQDEFVQCVSSDIRTDGSVGKSILFTRQSEYSDEVRLEEFGLYLPACGYWLDNEKSLASYALKPSRSIDMADGDILELQHRRHFIRTLSNSHYMEGWLQKKGDKSIVWKRRFFILQQNTLHWHKSHKDGITLGHIDLSKPFELTPPQNNDIRFSLVCKSKTYRLQAESRRDCDHWIRVLTQIYDETNDIAVPRFALTSLASDINNKSLLLDAAEDTWSSSTEDTFSDDDVADIPLSTTYRPSLSGAFSHMRLSDIVRRNDFPKVGSIVAVPSTISTANVSSHVDIQGDKIGYLYKKGNVNKSLQHRLFVLRDKILYYYRVASKKQETSLANSNYEYAGMINLEGCRIFGDQKQGKKAWIFRIVTPSRVYVISTDDADEWHDWRDAFEYISGIVVDTSGPPTVPGSSYEEIGLMKSGNRNSLNLTNLCADSSDESPRPAAAPYKPHHEKLQLDFAKLGEPEFEGVLWKRGNDRIRKWRKRYFVLAGRTLFYMESQTSEPIGSIPLSICQLQKPDPSSPPKSPVLAPTSSTHFTPSDRRSNDPQSLTFDLTMRNDNLAQPVLRVWHLKADSYDTYSAWIKSIAVQTETNKELLQSLLQS